MREYQVRICERLGVKFPGPTRQGHALWPAASIHVVPPIPTVDGTNREPRRDRPASCRGAALQRNFGQGHNRPRSVVDDQSSCAFPCAVDLWIFTSRLLRRITFIPNCAARGSFPTCRGRQPLYPRLGTADPNRPAGFSSTHLLTGRSADNQLPANTRGTLDRISHVKHNLRSIAPLTENNCLKLATT